MLLKSDNSVLLVIDVQERLLPHIHGGAEVVDHTGWLIRLAGRVGVPVLSTEQYPKGLGPTHAGIAALLPWPPAQKMHFSCVASGALASEPAFAKTQFVLCGIEAHVCVLQTAVDLRAMGREVFVVNEATGSRRASDKTLALERLRAHGAEIVSREMVAFEWLHESGTPLFKDVSREFLR
jgi:nicotinamidase-related amidase